jgi:rRNA maturation endonuclease Nob1
VSCDECGKTFRQDHAQSCSHCGGTLSALNPS